MGGSSFRFPSREGSGVGPSLQFPSWEGLGVGPSLQFPSCRVVNYAVSIQQPLPEFPHSFYELPSLPTPGPSGGGEIIARFPSWEGLGVGPPLSSPPGRG